ncbi:MAG: hypothetical protein ACOC2I_03230 [Halanaerobium sp.]
MKKTAYITGADRGLGFSLTERFLAEGYYVFAGQYLEDWNWLDELQKNLEADIEAEESAAEIYKNFVQNKNNFKKIYYDYQGNLLPW